MSTTRTKLDQLNKLYYKLALLSRKEARLHVKKRQIQSINLHTLCCACAITSGIFKNLCDKYGLYCIIDRTQDLILWQQTTGWMYDQILIDVLQNQTCLI